MAYYSSIRESQILWITSTPSRTRIIDKDNPKTPTVLNETRHFQIDRHNTDLVSICLWTFFPYFRKKSHNINYINNCLLNAVVRILKKYGVEIKLRNNFIPTI